jgi:shikimate kinase
MDTGDQLLRNQLRNVYWIGGGACGGKTTIANMVAERHGLRAYHCEAEYDRHLASANPVDHPAMLRKCSMNEWFLGQSIEEWVEAIRNRFHEQLPMVLSDLAAIAETESVIAEGGLLDAGNLKLVAHGERAVFLYADRDTIRQSFFGRPEHREMEAAIDRLDRRDEARENVLTIAEQTSEINHRQAVETAMRYSIRDTSTSIERTLAFVEEHFALV